MGSRFSVTPAYLVFLKTYCPLLYPRHLCRGVYSFRLSVRPFVWSFVRLFVRSFVLPSRSWNYFKVLRQAIRVEYISPTTIVFVFPFVRSYGRSFVCLFVRSYFRPVRGITSKFYVKQFEWSISHQPLIREHSYLDHRYPGGSAFIA